MPPFLDMKKLSIKGRKNIPTYVFLGKPTPIIKSIKTPKKVNFAAISNCSKYNVS